MSYENYGASYITDKNVCACVKESKTKLTTAFDDNGKVPDKSWS